MFKIAAALLMLVVACNGFLGVNVGSYSDRLELLADPTVLALTSYVAEYLSTSQNLFLNNLQVIRVQTKVINGISYKIDFTAEPVDGASGQTTTCQVIINVRFDSVKDIVQTQCQTL